MTKERQDATEGPFTLIPPKFIGVPGGGLHGEHTGPGEKS